MKLTSFEYSGLGGFALHRGRIRQGCLEEEGSTIRYTGLCGINFSTELFSLLFMSYLIGVLFCMRADIL